MDLPKFEDLIRSSLCIFLALISSKIRLRADFHRAIRNDVRNLKKSLGNFTKSMTETTATIPKFIEPLYLYRAGIATRVSHSKCGGLTHLLRKAS
jgi:hypothetical protein